VVNRRTLVLGGGAALLAAGCGKDFVVAPPPAEPALLRALAAERALGATMAALDKPRLAARSRERATRLAAELSSLGARPHDAPAPEAQADVAAGLRRGHAALEAYVAALPSLDGREQRGLGADLLAGAAGDVALLGNAFGIPADDPFPGTPA
jgi:hypothetical protein